MADDKGSSRTPEFFGRFEIRGQIERGTAFPLLVAFDPVLGREVALRELGAGADSRRMLTDELRRSIATMAAISHPNCVRVFDLLDDTEPPVVVMEHVPGATLEEILGRGTPLSPPEASAALAGALEGLDHLHSHGLSHGCMTPSRVLVDPSGTSKLRDVGVDHRGDPLAASYLAPEVLAGGEVTHAGDLYAAGALLYACLEGRAPFAAAPGVLAGSSRLAPAMATSAGSGELAELVDQAMSPDPERRPSSAREFLDRLLAAGEAAFGPAWRPAATVALAGLGAAGATAIASVLAATVGGAAVAGAVTSGAAAGASVSAGAVSGAGVGGGAVTGSAAAGGSVTGASVTGGSVTGASATGGASTGGAATGNAAGHAVQVQLRRNLRRVARSARRTRTVAVHHPFVSSVVSVVVVASAAAVILSGSAPALASSWHLASASVAPSALSCPDTQHCVGIEGSEVVVVTGGSPVRLVPLPASAGTLVAIECASDTHCFAVGHTASNAGIVETSVDGGLIWAKAAAPAALAPLVAISCAPRTTACWATGGTSLIATTDGGTWHRTGAPTTVGSYALISCATTASCVASASGALLTTSDGGTRWQAVTESFPQLFGPSSIDCVSARVCWMVGNSYAGLPPTSIPEVFRSSDGGLTWTSAPLNSPISMYETNYISCSSAKACVLDGTANDGGLTGSSGSPVFATTANGGASWTVRHSAPTMVSAPGLDCFSSGLCWLWGKGGLGTTTDAGTSWSPTLLPATLTPGGLYCSTSSSCLVSGAAPFASFEHVGIGGTNPNAPFVVTGTTAGGVLGVTGDGGTSWGFTLTDLKLSGLGALSCTSATSCELAGTVTSSVTELFVLAKGALRRLAAPTGLSAVSGLSCADGTCYLSGVVSGKATVERSIGSGRWSAVKLPATISTVGDISCPTSTTCVVAATIGSTPTLLATSSSGKLKAFPLPADITALGALDCASATTCWVGATSTTQTKSHVPVVSEIFLRTTSIGSPPTPHASRWSVEALPAGLGLPSAISCPSVSACMAVVPDQASGFVVLDAGQLQGSIAGEITSGTTSSS